MKKFYILNNHNNYKIFSSRGHLFSSRTGAFLSFCTWYRDRKIIPADIRSKIFEGIPKTGVYSKEKTSKIKEIFQKYYSIIEVSVD